MKDAQATAPAPRALLIPLDDREALLALRDFQRPRPPRGTSPPGKHGRAGAAPAEQAA